MTTILGNVFREYRLVSAGQLQAELNMFRQDLSTGLVEIAYPGSDTYHIIFTEGRPNEIYQHGPGRVQRLDSINPHTFFANKGEASLRICPVPLRFFRAIKTILAFTADDQQIVTQTPDVIAQLAVLQKTPEPVFIQITWPSSEGFVFLPGNNWPAREFLFISEGQARDNNPGVTIISRWPERECTFHIYRWNPAITTWHENNLFIGFSTIFEKILERYDELAGRALVTRLENDLNTTSRNLSIKLLFLAKPLTIYKSSPQPHPQSRPIAASSKPPSCKSQQLLARALSGIRWKNPSTS